MTDMLPGDPAIRLYPCKDPRYLHCRRPAGQRCVDSKGNPTQPHGFRFAQGQAYADAYNLLHPRVLDLGAKLTRAAAANTDLQTKITQSAEDLVTVRQDLEAETRALKAALQRIDDLEHPDPDVPVPLPTPDPVPQAPPFLVGGCPPSPGGTSTAAGQRVVALLGKGATDRQFLATPSTVAPRPADASRVTVSYSFESDTTARTTPAQWAKATKPLLDGVDLVGWYHEFDSKVRAKKYTLEAVTAAMRHNLAALGEARPDLDTVAILTGWLFSPSAGAPGEAARDSYGPICAEHSFTGIDLDGIHTWPYPDYTKHIPNILRWLDKHGIDQFVVSEMGWSKLGTKKGDVFTPHSHDPDGMIRVEQYAELLDALKATGRCMGADLFLYDTTPGYNLTSPGEVGRAQQIVAQAARA